jgi:hypothetical protein
MPEGVKDAVASAYGAGGLEAAGEIAERLGLEMTGKNLQRRIEEHTKFMRNVFKDDSDQTVVEALATLKPTWSVPPPGVSNRQNPVGLTDIYHIDVLTDQGPWLEWLNDAAAGKRYITVMHAADIHFPFENKAAMEVFYQLVEHIQPDLIVVGSDAGDFALVSTFARDPDLDEETSDVLDEFKLHWDRFVERLRKAAPGAMLVWIWGNHERRILRYITISRLWSSRVQQLMDVGKAAFTQLSINGGLDVWWGRAFAKIEVGELFKHETRCTIIGEGSRLQVFVNAQSQRLIIEVDARQPATTPGSNALEATVIVLEALAIAQVVLLCTQSQVAAKIQQSIMI